MAKSVLTVCVEGGGHGPTPQEPFPLNRVGENMIRVTCDSWRCPETQAAIFAYAITEAPTRFGMTPVGAYIPQDIDPVTGLGGPTIPGPYTEDPSQRKDRQFVGAVLMKLTWVEVNDGVATRAAERRLRASKSRLTLRRGGIHTTYVGKRAMREHPDCVCTNYALFVYTSTLEELTAHGTKDAKMHIQIYDQQIWRFQLARLEPGKDYYFDHLGRFVSPEHRRRAARWVSESVSHALNAAYTRHGMQGWTPTMSMTLSPTSVHAEKG